MLTKVFPPALNLNCPASEPLTPPVPKELHPAISLDTTSAVIGRVAPLAELFSSSIELLLPDPNIWKFDFGILIPTPIELAVNVLLILVVPTTFSDDTIVTPCKVVFPDTFSEDIKVVAPFKVFIPCKLVFPETFNEDTKVVAPCKVVFPDTFNEDTKVLAPVK